MLNVDSLFAFALRNGVFWCIVLGMLLVAQPARAQEHALLAALEEYVQDHPHNIDKRLEYAGQLVEHGNNRAAIEQLERVHEARPRDLDVLERLAQLYGWSGQVEKQIATYERVLRITPNALDLRRSLATLYFENNRPQEGIRQLELVLEARPHDLSLRRALARRYFWNEQPQQGIQQLERILAARPDSLALRRELARHYFWNNRSQEGIRQLERILEARPDSLALRRELADRYFWDKQPQEGIRQLERILEARPDDLDARRELAKRHFWSDRRQEGIRQLELILEQRPDSLGLRRKLAQHYTSGKAYEEAADQYRAILRRAPGDLAAAEHLGQVLMAAEQHTAAAMVYRQVVEADASNTEARLILAKALAWSDQPDQALGHLKVVLRQAPDSAEALLLAGELQRWKPVAWFAGKQNLERLLTLDPDNERARQLLRGLRRDYGPTLQAQFGRVTDSNGLTREEIPLAFAGWASGAWKLAAFTGYSRLADARAGREQPISSYDLAGAVTRGFPSGTTVHARLGASVFASGWTPMTGRLELRQNVFRAASVTLSAARDNVPGSAKALQERILQHRLRGAWYARPLRRLEVWGQGTYVRYSDQNEGSLASVSARLYAFLEKPMLALLSTYSYQDTKRIHPHSRPYWTPHELSTFSSRLEFEHPLSSWLTVGGSYGVARQEEVSQNFGIELKIAPGDFHAFEAAFEQTGSDVYASSMFTVRYAYRIGSSR